MPELPLEGIRIVDSSMYFAIPVATKLLGYMGAEVIHVESCSHLDGARVETIIDNKPQPGFWNQSGTFYSQNLNKFGLALELNRPEGREIFLELVKISDVVAENFSPRVMKNFGLDYSNLKKVKPDIIMISSTGYGGTGPYRDYVSVGLNTEPMCGLTGITGYPGKPPSRCSIAWSDEVVAVASAFAILAALRYRKRTGKGQWIDLSQYEVMVTTLPEMIMDYVMNGRAQARIGNRDSHMSPHGCYRCRGDDNWVVIAVSSDQEWHSLCQAMGNSSLAKDERFSDTLNRWKHQDELDPIIEEWTIRQDNYEVMHKLQSVGVAAAPVLNSVQFYSDPHLKARSFYKTITHSTEWEGHKVIRPYPDTVWRMSKTPGKIRLGAPNMGQHNEYILGQILGKSKDEINRLRTEGIIGEAPLRYEVGPALPLDSMVQAGFFRGYDANYLEILSKALGMELS